MRMTAKQFIRQLDTIEKNMAATARQIDEAMQATPRGEQPERYPLFDHFHVQRLERIETAAVAFIKAQQAVHEHKTQELDGWTPQVAAWQEDHHELCEAHANAFVALAAAVGRV